jgi:hypothetical protein
MNLFDLYENREPYQQAIDKLEHRRIEDLEAKMDDYARRGMKDEFQKCKAERDGYYKVKNTSVDEAGIGQDLVTPQQRVQGAKSQKQTPIQKVGSTVRHAANWLAGKGGPGREGPTYEQEELDEKLKGLPTKKLGSARDAGKSIRKFRAQRGLEEAGTDSQWSKESDWKAIPKAKSGRPADPRGEVTHLSDVARREAERNAAQKKNSEEVAEEGSRPRDLAAAVMLKKARAAFPIAQDDAEALAMWIAAKEQRDVDHLEHENEQEEEMIARIMDQLKKTNVDEAEQQLAIASKYTGDGQFQITVNNKHKYIVTVAGFEINPMDPGILDSFYLTDVATGKTHHVTGGWDPVAVAIFNNLDKNQKPALKDIYQQDMAFYDEHDWDGSHPDRLQGLDKTVRSGYNAIPADRFIKGHQDMKKVTGQDVDEEQKPPGFGEFPPKQEIKIDPPRKLKSGQTYQDQNKYWQAQGQAPIYKTNEGDQIRLGDVQPGTAGYDAWSKSTHKTGEPGKNPQPADKSDYNWTEKQKIMPKVVPEAANPAQQAAIAIAMKKAHKKPKHVDEAIPVIRGTQPTGAQYANQLAKIAMKLAKQRHADGLRNDAKDFNKAAKLFAAGNVDGGAEIIAYEMDTEPADEFYAYMEHYKIPTEIVFGVNEETTRLDPKCWTGKKIGSPKTKMKGGVRVNNCVPAEESYTGVMESQGITDPKLLEVARRIDRLAENFK